MINYTVQVRKVLLTVWSSMPDAHRQTQHHQHCTYFFLKEPMETWNKNSVLLKQFCIFTSQQNSKYWTQKSVKLIVENCIILWQPWFKSKVFRELFSFSFLISSATQWQSQPKNMPELCKQLSMGVRCLSESAPTNEVSGELPSFISWRQSGVDPHSALSS